MSFEPRDQAEPAELHGAQPSEPLPIVWTHFVETEKKYAERPAVVSLHQRGSPPPERSRREHDCHLQWTYSELHSRVETLASQLFALGVKKGSVIGTLIDNCAEWALLFWTAVRLDAIFMPLAL